MKKIFLAILTSFCLVSCATIFTSGKASVRMDAKNVDGTTVPVNGLERGTTPLTFKIED